MKRIFSILIESLFVLFFAFMIAFAKMEAKWIVLLALVLCAIELYIVYSNVRGLNRMTHFPLLFDVLILIVPLVMIFCGKVPIKIMPSLLCIVAASVLSIIYLVVDKPYAGKSLKDFIVDNLRLPPLLDIVIVLEAVKRFVASGWTCGIWFYLLLAYAVIDFCFQFKRLSNHEVDFF